MDDVFKCIDNFSGNKNIKSILMSSQYEIDQNSSFVISIVMPVYKPDLTFFREAVLSAKNQKTSFSYDIIIVDNDPYDGNENDVEKLVKSLKLKNYKYYRNQENLGMTGNWNRCIELADAPLITYCHADDKLAPNCIDILMGIHKKYPEFMIGSVWNTIDGTDEIINEAKPGKRKGLLKLKPYWKVSLFDLFHGGMGFGCGCLFDKDKMIKIGGFNDEYYPSADYALFLNYCYHYGMIYSEVPTFNYRIAVNESKNVWRKFAERDKEFREFMIPKIHLPNKFLEKYSEVIYCMAINSFSKTWGSVNDEELPAVNVKDKLLYKVVNKVRRLKVYQLSF